MVNLRGTCTHYPAVIMEQLHGNHAVSFLLNPAPSNLDKLPHGTLPHGPAEAGVVVCLDRVHLHQPTLLVSQQQVPAAGTSHRHQGFRKSVKLMIGGKIAKVSGTGRTVHSAMAN